MGDTGAAATDPLRAEAAALFSDVHLARSWDLARRKCAVAAFVVPLLFAVLIAWVASGRMPWIPPADTYLASMVLVFVPVSAWFVFEFGEIGAWGGGFAAMPDGLEIRYGRRRWMVPWEQVAGARSVVIDWWGKPYRVVEIGSSGDGRSWPWRASLHGSNGSRLCVSTFLLPGTEQLIAGGITAALAEARSRTVSPDAAEDGSARAAPDEAR
jgi:hypothetical protein